MGPEVLDDQVDLVNLEFRDVEQHGDLLTGWQPFRFPVDKERRLSASRRVAQRL